MKIMINDVRRTYEKIKDIRTLKQFVELCKNNNSTLIEIVDYKRIHKCLAKDYELKRVKNCDIIITEHNGYIE